MNEQLEFVKEIARRLDNAGIPYMLTGSLAMAVYAVPRMTRDIDIVVEVAPKDVKRFAQLFSEDCYVDEDTVRDAISSRTMFNVIHNRWIIKADFIVRKDDPYHDVEFTRRGHIDVEGVRVAIVAPEDLILSKLVWAKESQSELQQRDIVQLIQGVKDLDWPYLERWAVTLGVADDLKNVRSA
jgi:hypothetical protein